ncbi:hypothetical protein [Anaerostipes caccae]|uniref:hypothetical protein n=1 Tax=Anaerostipes caccae TaxID=105841 RepID=UPI0038D3AB1C
MWLINFHLGFSILLLAAYIGIVCMFRKDIKKKIRGLKSKKKLEIIYNGEDQE